MLVHDRHQQIIQLIHEVQSVRTTELIQRFGVSFETIRRDLEYLEQEGFLKRVHGGATLPVSDYQKELPFTVREMKQLQEKRELAQTALRFVEEGQSLFLDVSTTNTEFAKALMARFDRLTIVTNSFPIASLLMGKPQFSIIFIGGVVRNSEHCVVGDFAESFVSQFHADLFFMSVSGISLAEGLTDYGIGEIQLKKKMLERSQKVIVLADSSKLDTVSLTKVCGLDKIDRIVTDCGAGRDVIEKYRQAGVTIDCG
ncbi:DeoR/GlpR family DNA-binding transcription regulator [Paenibacillus brevis]|uniref:DeoR/GlpR family DNA-binding transcription regulator n=1 Tax=Paenibacillus brevis TaxID=2841508 RepID=A0ABS6FMR5_9BACL|nr:DeoR/GlpR family DNA-binding transcription regulator [Paenibacillus brevis]MBU5670501.1 DeoR/GlpR family DNA-binding transcription regulator [Paenibacillus brevis]